MPPSLFVKKHSSLTGFTRRKIIALALTFIIFAFAFFISFGLRPVSQTQASRLFSITPGEGFRLIIDRLNHDGFIRSSTVVKFFAFLTGSAHRLKPGFYELSPHLSGSEIIRRLVKGGEEVTVIIPEGFSVYEIDERLSQNKIILPGSLAVYSAEPVLEGRLFPDTYQFLTGSRIETVVDIFLEGFEKNLDPLLKAEPEKFEANLILASLVEKEVAEPEDRRLVAGILEKRLKAGVPLQVDATICYLKKRLLPELKNCYPITKLDLSIDSPYNTYKYGGLPPGPIVSPGVSAVRSVLEENSSPYWFYLSDPKTGKTRFAETLEKHNRNIFFYLKD